MSVIRRLGVWLRAGRLRFAMLVVLLIVLQTVVLTFFRGGAAVVAGIAVMLAMAVLAGAYASGTRRSR